MLRDCQQPSLDHHPRDERSHSIKNNVIESLHNYGQLHAASDICVIGAGAVGLPLAVDLAQRGHSVTLLEAGTDHVNATNQGLMSVEQTGKHYRTPTLDRYRVLGGGTLFWGGQIFELGDHIVHSRPHVPSGSWPIASQELAAYYRRAAELLGMTPGFDDRSVWEQLSSRPKEMAEDILQIVLSRWVPTRHFPKLFRRNLETDNRIRVLLDATVTGFGGSSETLTHVRAKSLNGTTAEIHARHFIVAAGAVENARLLMHPLLSGTDSAWSTNGNLGRYLTDHIGAVIGEFQPTGTNYRNYFETVYVNGRKFWPKLRLKPDKQIELGLLDAACEFAFENQLRTHYDNFLLLLESLRSGVVPRGLGRMTLSLLGTVGALPSLVSRYLRDSRVGRIGAGGAAVKIILEQFPHRDSYVDLSDELDLFGLRKARVHWKVGSAESDTLRFMAKALSEYVTSHGLGTIAIDKAVYNDDFLAESGYDTIHQMGTTRMSQSASDGVVDGWGRVHGSTNLYVAGASVFPSCGFANPTFAALALALRTGSHISEQLCKH